jgi:hypothetical protein
MTNQSDRQASCRTISSKALTYNGDWMALADTYGLTGTINERMLKFFNRFLGSTWDVAAWDETVWDGDAAHTNLSEAESAFAKANGITGGGSLWNQLGTF